MAFNKGGPPKAPREKQKRNFLIILKAISNTNKQKSHTKERKEETITLHIENAIGMALWCFLNLYNIRKL